MTRIWLRLRMAVALLCLVSIAAPVMGQTGRDVPEDRRKVQLSTAERERLSEEEIVIIGNRLIEGDPPIPSSSVGAEVSASRGQFYRAEQFARCADKPRIDLLRRVVDGPPNDADTRHALDTLIRTNLGCYPDFPRVPLASLSPPELGTCHLELGGNLSARPPDLGGDAVGLGGKQMCRAVYTRSAIIEQVMRTYAPDLALSRADTWRDDVRRRFDGRERGRNAKRLERDFEFFAVAACLVQAEPELSTSLLRAPPAGDLSLRIQHTMFARAPHCVGFATSVKTDPAQFRTYIADAVYRWLVAVRDVDSLIPA